MTDIIEKKRKNGKNLTIRFNFIQFGPQGAYLGNLKYQAQFNQSENYVGEKLKIWICRWPHHIRENKPPTNIGMSSHNIRTHIPNDIISSNMVIPPQNLKSQGFLEDVQKWTKSQLRTINERRRKNKMQGVQLHKKRQSPILKELLLCL